MREFEKGAFNNNDEIFSELVKAGKRTYYFDVKETKKGDYYLTITERTRRYNEDGTFNVQKHKIFLYQEDFHKFQDTLKNTIDFISDKKPFVDRESELYNIQKNKIEKTETTHEEESIEYYQAPEILKKKKEKKQEPNDDEIINSSYFTDISFEDLYD